MQDSRETMDIGHENGPVRDSPVVDVIRDAIRQGLLPPGMPLVQASLASAFGVSRVPVREALQYLASEGLVTLGHDGARVTLLTPAEVHELWSLRAVLETAMADATVRNVRSDGLEALERLVHAMDTATDPTDWSDLNYTFHTTMYRIARLPHHARAASRVLTLIEPYSRTVVDHPEGKAAAQEEHHKMLSALQRRDTDALREVLNGSSVRAREFLGGLVQEPGDVAALVPPRSRAAREFALRFLGDSTSTGD